jgi:Tol biopolymer transport system component
MRLTSDSAGTAGLPEAAPSWGTDGQIVFTATLSGNADLAHADVAAAPSTPALISAANSSAAEVEAAWSPDGSQITFISDRTGATRLYLFDLASNTTVEIPEAGDDVAQPAWLPDARIVFATYRGGVWQLHWLDTREPADIHDIPLPAGNPQHPAVVR